VVARRPAVRVRRPATGDSVIVIRHQIGSMPAGRGLGSIASGQELGTCSFKRQRAGSSNRSAPKPTTPCVWLRRFKS
jgi:hypothetical protein